MASEVDAPTPSAHATQLSWFNYRTIWRWHFYAGLFCIPFIIWLSITGSMFLFKPQVERWLDRPFSQLHVQGAPAAAAAQAAAALAAVPGANLHYYQLPRSSHEAVQIIVGKGRDEFRVYVHPGTLRILKVENEDARPMKVISRLHGELLMGDRGSLIVELAASWAIVMVVTGLYLWWPRQSEKLAGVVFIRLRRGKRIFWRDLHAVTGIWVSAFALFLLLTGLPWARSWGGYLKTVRAVSGKAITHQDWTTGRSSEIAQRLALDHNSMAGMAGMDDMADMPGMSAAHGDASAAARADHKPAGASLDALDRMVAAVAPLGLAYPVLISPPMHSGGPWTAKSDAQDRPLREDLTLDPKTGAILTRQGFHQRGLIDRMVGIGVAAHEGQLFGVLNQLLELCTAMGLLLLSLSAVVLWWRRRDVGVLGAPVQLRGPRYNWVLGALAIGFGLYLPMLGITLVLVLCLERFVLRRIPAASRWLGLTPVRA